MKHLSLAFLTVSVVLSSQGVPEVKLEHGVIKGRFQQTRKGRVFGAFYGIPYAKPPVGELRFKPPMPIEPWPGILDASITSPVCPQSDTSTVNFSIIGEEDCLYLNIYTPCLLNCSTSGGLPVMFYIHGGGFFEGSGNPDFYGPDILLDKNVVLVTINYRLGALGFLSTEDESLPGNYGLKDQSLALKWAKENIAPFGGDPNRITIFGQSAGGASVHNLMLSDLSKNLISGAISFSGVSVARWALAADGEALRNAKKLASFVNCSSDSIPNMVKCLKATDVYDIINQEKKFMEFGTHPIIPFKPVIEPKNEGAFLAENPINIIKTGKAANVPFIIVVDTQDGAIESAEFYNNATLIQNLNKQFNTLLTKILFFNDYPNEANITSKIRRFYFGDKDIDNSTKYELTDLFTDAWSFCPANVIAGLHAKFTKQPVYYLMFGYRGTLSLSAIYGNPAEDFGVCHGDELLYLFSNQKFPDHYPSESDLKMSDLLTTLLENFATSGTPTPSTDAIISTEWQPVRPDHPISYYFVKNYSDVEMVDNFHKERAQFCPNFLLKNHFVKIEN